MQACSEMHKLVEWSISVCQRVLWADERRNHATVLGRQVIV